MRQGEFLDEATYAKITMRHLGNKGTPKVDLISGEEIRGLSEQAHLSQAVFASYLNLTAGYISQLERGTKLQTGPALVLLNVIRRKGFDAILKLMTLGSGFKRHI